MDSIRTLMAALLEAGTPLDDLTGLDDRSEAVSLMIDFSQAARRLQWAVVDAAVELDCSEIEAKEATHIPPSLRFSAQRLVDEDAPYGEWFHYVELTLKRVNRWVEKLPNAADTADKCVMLRRVLRRVQYLRALIDVSLAIFAAYFEN